jgi:hypothetical protein
VTYVSTAADGELYPLRVEHDGYTIEFEMLSGRLAATHKSTSCAGTKQQAHRDSPAPGLADLLGGAIVGIGIAIGTRASRMQYCKWRTICCARFS